MRSFQTLALAVVASLSLTSSLLASASQVDGVQQGRQRNARDIVNHGNMLKMKRQSQQTQQRLARREADNRAYNTYQKRRLAKGKAARNFDSWMEVREQKRSSCSASSAAVAVPSSSAVSSSSSTATNGTATATATGTATGTASATATIEAANRIAQTTSSAAAASSSSSSNSASTDGKVTFFEVGLGACGWTNKNSDYIAAISHVLWNSIGGGGWEGNKVCGKKVQISNGSGTTIEVEIADMCPSCDAGHLDLSPSAFSALGSQDKGVLPVTWSWVGGTPS